MPVKPLKPGKESQFHDGKQREATQNRNCSTFLGEDLFERCSDDVKGRVLDFLSEPEHTRDLASLACCSRTWRDLCKTRHQPWAINLLKGRFGTFTKLPVPFSGGRLHVAGLSLIATGKTAVASKHGALAAWRSEGAIWRRIQHDMSVSFTNEMMKTSDVFFEWMDFACSKDGKQRFYYLNRGPEAPRTTYYQTEKISGAVTCEEMTFPAGFAAFSPDGNRIALQRDCAPHTLSIFTKGSGQWQVEQDCGVLTDSGAPEKKAWTWTACGDLVIRQNKTSTGPACLKIWNNRGTRWTEATIDVEFGTAMAAHPHQGLIVVACRNEHKINRLEIWDVRARHRVAALVTECYLRRANISWSHFAELTALAWSPSGKFLCAGYGTTSWFPLLEIYRVDAARQLRLIWKDPIRRPCQHRVASIAFGTDEQHLFYTLKGVETVYSFDFAPASKRVEENDRTY